MHDMNVWTILKVVPVLAKNLFYFLINKVANDYI